MSVARRWRAMGVVACLIALPGAVSTGFAQQYLRVQPGPPISIEPPVIHLGSVLDSLAVTLSAVVKNQSDRPVHLVDVVANCTECIVSELDRTHLGPGESALLDMVYNPRFSAGNTKTFVAVITGSPDQPQATLEIDAVVEPSYDVKGTPVVFFKVIEGYPQTWRLTIEPRIALRSPLDEVVFGIPGFTGAITYEEEKGRYVVDIEAGAELSPGIHRTEVSIRSSAGDVPPCIMPVAATVQEQFVVVPDRLILTPSSREQFRMIVLEQHLTPPLQITGIELPGANCRYRLTYEDNLSKTWIKVYFKNVARLGGTGNIVIHTNHASYPTIEVPVITQDLASVIVEPDCPAARVAQQSVRRRR